MRLTLYTDYSLRVLLYLAAAPDRLSSISEIARAYGVSHNHLMKVVLDLREAGYVESVRGRFGGIRLARAAEAINVGAVVRRTEDDFVLVDCAHCVIAPGCELSRTFGRALAAFMAVLDGSSLADLARKSGGLATSLGIGGEAKPRPARAGPRRSRPPSSRRRRP